MVIYILLQHGSYAVYHLLRPVLNHIWQRLVDVLMEWSNDLYNEFQEHGSYLTIGVLKTHAH